MKLSKARYEFLSTYAMGALASLAFCAVAYFIWFASDAYYSADCADTFYWAIASIDSGKIFNPDFYYGGVYPFGGSLFFFLAYWIFGVSMVGAKFGMFLFLIFFTAALIFFAKSLGFNWKWTFASCFVILAALSCSIKLREIYFLHIIYYSLGNFQYLVGAALIFQYLKHRKEKRSTLFLVLAVLWLFLCSTNNLEGIVLLSLPLLLSLGFLVITEQKKVQLAGFIHTPLFFLCLLVLAAGSGYFFGRLLTKDVACGYAGAYSGFSDAEYWPDAFAGAPFQFVYLFCERNIGSVQFQTLDGIIFILQIAFSVALLIVPIVATFYCRQYKTTAERFVLVSHWATTFFILFAYVFGRLDSANWRLSPLIMTSLLVSIIFVRHLWAQKGIAKRFAVLLLTGCFVFAGVNSTRVLSMNPHEQQYENLQGLASYLEKSDIEYAYATFWNSLPITFMTDGKVQVANIEIRDNGVIHAHEYQSFASWYSGHEGHVCALLLTQSEYATLSAYEQANIESVEPWNQFLICRLRWDIFPR